MFGLMGDENNNLLTGIARAIAAGTREGRQCGSLVGYTGLCVLSRERESARAREREREREKERERVGESVSASLES